MAKKTKTEEVEINDDDVGRALAAIRKSYGDIVCSGQSLVDKKQMVIPVCPSMDGMLGGGFGEGSWVSMSGPPGCGKTVTALSFAANAQKPEYGSRTVFLYASEHRAKKRDLLGIKGLDISDSKFHIVKSEKGKILSSKDFLNIAGEFMKSVPNSVHIFDSVSSLISPKVLEEGIGTEDRSSGYKLIGQFCDIHSSTVPINNLILIGIIQMIANTSGMGKGSVEKGANKWFYQADVRLQCKWAEAWRIGSDENSQQIGQKLHWTIAKTALNVGPGGKAETYLRYGTGIDRVYEVLLYAKDIGLIQGSGSWLSFDYLDGEDKPKFQGMEKAYRALEENPEWFDKLIKMISTQDAA